MKSLYSYMVVHFLCLCSCTPNIVLTNIINTTYSSGFDRPALTANTESDMVHPTRLVTITKQ